MKKEELIQKVTEMKDAASCCPEAKEACEAYLASVGTEKEEAALKALYQELAEDVNDIDGFIAYVGSKTGPEAEAAVAAGREAKKNGATYCLCPACQAGGWILDHQNDFLK